MGKLKVILCVSGWLGEIALKAVLKTSYIRIMLVMTDKNSLSVIYLAKKNALAVFVGNPRKIKVKLEGAYDVIASVNYLFVLPVEILSKATQLAFNIHGSLLPKYMGRTPVTWVIINDEIETGITAHEMAADVDAGDIIYQEKIPISNNDTGGILLRKMSRRYPLVLAKIFEQIREKKIKRVAQDLQKKSYFGKREPMDGLIDWHWSARKIYNWVRAQTKPYPGAFGFIKGVKYQILKVEEVYPALNTGKPGSMVSGRQGKLIRCGQGAVRLVDYSQVKGE